MEALVIIAGSLFIIAASFSSLCLNPRTVRIIGALFLTAGLAGLTLSQGLISDPSFKTALFFVFSYTLGVVFAIAFARNVAALRSVDTRVLATLTAMAPQKKGFSPVFTFEHKGKSYTAQSSEVMRRHSCESLQVEQQA